MKNSKFILAMCFFLSTCLSIVRAGVVLPTIPTTQFSITSYGASVSSSDNSAAIDATITAANAAGGGVVVIPTGTFLSGPITMKSNVNLYISAGATLQMMPYGNGNGQPSGSYPNNGSTNAYTNFIYGSGLSNIEVSGSGVIEGDGSAWWTAYNANSNIQRPYLIRFKGCNKVLITGITLQNAPNVHICLGQSSNMGSNGTISNVIVIAPATSPNTDAIDVWYWNGVDILNCNLSEGDDNVAMDSYAQNVTIKHCVFGNGHGTSVGSYASNVENILVDSCTYNGTTNGIRLKSNRTRGGHDTSLVYSNITMNNVKYPFYITSWYPTEPYPASAQTAAAVTGNTPMWENITFKNIVVNNSTYAGIIYGLPEAYVTNIVFDSVQITATTSGLVTNFVNGLVFKNCSSITIPSSKGNAIVPYDATTTGIDVTTGASTACPPPSSSIVINVQATGSVSCFPNPVNGDELTIKDDSKIENVAIYNLAGQVLKTQTGDLQNQILVDLKGLPVGYYIVKIMSSDGRVNSMKLIRE